MAISYLKLFQPIELTGSAATIATIPANQTTNLLLNGLVRATNNTASAATVTIYAVPSGGSASAVNVLINAYSVPAYGWVDTALPIMAANDFISALSGTNTAITLHFMNGVIHS